jgi:hypothetical protein
VAKGYSERAGLGDRVPRIAYSKKALISEKAKHIGFKWHFLKDHEEHGTIMPRYLPTY